MENSDLNTSDPSLELITIARAPELMQIQMRRCEGVVLLMWGRRLSSNEWMMNYAHHSGWAGTENSQVLIKLGSACFSLLLDTGACSCVVCIL